MITKVTITGADDSIQPADLLNLSRRYPFVEWGILLSRNYSTTVGAYRFPSPEWIMSLYSMYQQHNEELQLSGHICGGWVKRILLGDDAFLGEMDYIWSMFSRIQLNTHAQPHGTHPDKCAQILKRLPSEIIFQIDDENNWLLDTLAKPFDLNFSALFDLSHGAGVLPAGWPDPIPGVRCGYAGGLGPDNLKGQIEAIEAKAGVKAIWIDMETRVRSNNDKQFDLGLVEQCLKIAEPFVS